MWIMPTKTRKPKPPDAKGDLVQIRVSASEKATWQAAALEDRRKLSDWLRLAAEAYLVERKSGARR